MSVTFSTRKALIALSASSAILTAPLASADEAGWYLGLKGYYVDLENSRDELTRPANPGNPPLVPATPETTENVSTEYDDGAGAGLIFGYRFHDGLRAEIEARQFTSDITESQSSTGTLFSGEAESTSLMANFWMEFLKDARFRPYAGMGLGAAEISKGDQEDSVGMAQLGFGVMMDLGERTVLDLGYRYVETDEAEFNTADGSVDSEYTANALALGLSYRVSSGQEVRDSDGDGVLDNRDLCPNTPLGRAVDDYGCELDSDGDGVANKNDACPSTPAGQKVMTNGCGVAQAAVLRGVNFEFNSATLTYNAETILDRTARTLLDSPGFDVLITGHTDSKGSDSYNMQLSKERAQSVRRYLVSKGVDGARLEFRGYGETKPVASNDTEAGRAENRRVELEVVGERN